MSARRNSLRLTWARVYSTPVSRSSGPYCRWKPRLRGGGMCLEVSEHLTTQTCSEGGCLPPSRPRGIAGLRISEWICADCGAVHDRDVNAARNILRIERDALVEGDHARKHEPRSPAFRQGSSHSSLCATRTNQRTASTTTQTRTIKQIVSVSVERSKTLPIALAY